MDLEYTLFSWSLFINGLFLGNCLARLANRQPLTIMVLSIIALVFSYGSIPFSFNPGHMAHADTLGRVSDAVARLGVSAGAYGLAAASRVVYLNSKRKALSPQAKPDAA